MMKMLHAWQMTGRPRIIFYNGIRALEERWNKTQQVHISCRRLRRKVTQIQCTRVVANCQATKFLNNAQNACC